MSSRERSEALDKRLARIHIAFVVSPDDYVDVEASVSISARGEIRASGKLTSRELEIAQLIFSRAASHGFLDTKRGNG